MRSRIVVSDYLDDEDPEVAKAAHKAYNATLELVALVGAKEVEQAAPPKPKRVRKHGAANHHGLKAWCDENGIEWAAGKGRPPKRVLEAYAAAHPEEPDG